MNEHNYVNPKVRGPLLLTNCVINNATYISFISCEPVYGARLCRVEK